MPELLKDFFGEVVTSRVPNPKIYLEINDNRTHSVLTDKKRNEIAEDLDDFISNDASRETQK